MLIISSFADTIFDDFHAWKSYKPIFFFPFQVEAIN